MASFDTAYNTYIKPNEGGYAFVPGDKGGETYAGIARNYFGNWPGWVPIDFYKRTKGAPKLNQKFPDVQQMVDQFYRDWWNAKRFGEINSQEVSNLLFDYNVNSGSLAVKAIQRLVGQSADGSMGVATITAINKANPAKLHNDLKEERRQLFTRLAQQRNQSQFLKGWMARLNRFEDLAKPGIGILAILVTVGAIYLIVKMKDKPEAKRMAVGRVK